MGTRKLDPDPSLLIHRSGRQQGGLRKVAAGQRRYVERAAAGSHFGLQFGERAVALRVAICHYHAVRVEILGRRGNFPSAAPAGKALIRSGRKWRFGQRAGERMSPFHAGLAPHVLLHGLRGRHPRAATLAPSRRTGDGHLQPQLVGQRSGVFEGVFPFRRHEHQALFHDLRRIQTRVKVLKASNSNPLHPFQVGLDAFLCDVAAHPVPPDARLCAIRRVLETSQERIARVLRGDNPCPQYCRCQRSPTESASSHECSPLQRWLCMWTTPPAMPAASKAAIERAASHARSCTAPKPNFSIIVAPGSHYRIHLLKGKMFCNATQTHPEMAARIGKNLSKIRN